MKLTHTNALEICLQVFDWGGHGAVGDDLLACIARERLARNAAAIGMQLKSPRIFARPDAFVVGGGTVFGHGPFFDRLARRILKSGKEYFVFGSGARIPSCTLAEPEKQLLRDFCENAAAIGVRGEITRDWLESTVGYRAEIVGDVALGFIPVDVSPLPEGFRAGVSVRYMDRGLRLRREATHPNQNERMMDFLGSVCDALVRRYDAQLFFFDLGRNYFDSDLKGIHGVLERMKERRPADDATVFSFTQNRDPYVAFSRLGQMDVVVSQRMHPALLGWLQGVPAVGVDYQFRKGKDAFSILGVDGCPVKAENLDVEHCLASVAHALENRDRLLELVRRSREHYMEKQDMFIREFLSRLK